MMLECNFCGREIEIPDPEPSDKPLSITFVPQSDDGSVNIHMNIYACTECFKRVKNEE